MFAESPPHLPREFTEEKDEEDVAGGDGDAGDQRHPGHVSFNTHSLTKPVWALTRCQDMRSFTLSFQIVGLVSSLIRAQWVEW